MIKLVKLHCRELPLAVNCHFYILYIFHTKFSILMQLNLVQILTPRAVA